MTYVGAEAQLVSGNRSHYVDGMDAQYQWRVGVDVLLLSGQRAAGVVARFVAGESTSRVVPVR